MLPPGERTQFDEIVIRNLFAQEVGTRRLNRRINRRHRRHPDYIVEHTASPSMKLMAIALLVVLAAAYVAFMGGHA